MAASTPVTPDAGGVEPYTEQEPFLWDRHRYYGFISGVGAGKTAAGIMRAALNVELWNPGYMGAIVAPNTTMIKNAILPLMRKFGLMEAWTYQGPQAEAPGIHTPNGSRILILSANDERQVERLAALNLAWWWIDEERDVPPRARQILIQRLRDGEYTNGFVTTTPKGQNHTFNFFVGHHAPDELQYGDATVFEADDRLAITGVPTDANPYLDPEDVQAIRDAHPSGLLEQEVEGLFIEIGAGVLSKDQLRFAEPDEIIDEETGELRRRMKWVIGVDLGHELDRRKAESRDSDYYAATLIGVDVARATAYVMDMHRTRGKSLKEAVSWLSGISQQARNATINVEAVSGQKHFLSACRDAGLNVRGIDQSSSKEDRILQLSIPVESGDIRFLNRGVDPQLGYDPRFEAFVREWLAFPDGSHDDLLDSLELAVRSVDFGGYGTILGGDMYDRDRDDERSDPRRMN